MVFISLCKICECAFMDGGDSHLMLEVPLTSYGLVFSFFSFFFLSSRTWMLWPVRNDVWGKNTAPACAAYAAVALAIADFEPVFVGVPIGHYAIVRAMFGDHPNITVLEISQDDAWARDTFPTFLRNSRTGNVRGVDWIFNGYGGLYSPSRDNLLTAKVRVCPFMDRINNLENVHMLMIDYTTCTE